jgi:glycosyltransferase involved in cell wall biosynthesis
MTPPLRVGVIADLVEEGWPSMDLVADMLVQQLDAAHAGRILVRCFRPPLVRRLSRASSASRSRMLVTMDRIANRFFDYPRLLRSSGRDCDVYHVIDHSYSQLVHDLPAERTVITCHDLDTFRCLLEPREERRAAPFRAMTRRILDGFRKAARVTCDTAAVRDELLHYDLIAPERLVVAPNGVHPACRPGPHREGDRHAAERLGPAGAFVDLLHVGSIIPRKRVDVLLGVVAEVRRRHPQVRLVRAGGPLAADQVRLARALDLLPHIVTLPALDRETLAAVYRRCAMLLLPSAREGFGLPIIEAMACGTPVVAADIAALREVGGPAASYCAVGDVDGWVATIHRMLAERVGNSAAWAARRDAGVRQAARFGWAAYADRMVGLYEELAGAPLTAA